MNEFPDKAKSYEALKMSLVDKCNHVQKAYTDGKQDFIEKALYEARKWAKKSK